MEVCLLASHSPTTGDITTSIACEWSHGCRSVEPSVRSNLVVALGDLAFRFPNLLEPWTERIYGPLSDPDTGDPQHDSQPHIA